MIDSPDPLLGRRARGPGGSTAVLDPHVGRGGAGGGVPDDVDAPGPPGRGGHRSRAVWLVTAAVVGLGLVFVTVLPVQRFLQQRQAIDRAESELAALEADNAGLAARVAELGTDAALEELAREQLNLVRDGEEAFAMLPPQFPSNLPPLFPYPLARRLLEAKT